MDKIPKRAAATSAASEPTAPKRPISISRTQRSRDTTRAKLIAAAGRVMAQKGVDGTTIADITEAADVGTGSFYNHFSTKTEIAEILFLQHADELARINSIVFDREEDPALAVTYIHKIFFTKAQTDPVWGWFVVHATADIPQMAHVFSATAADHIRRGRSAGRFSPPDVDAAVRIILASLMAGMRDLLEDPSRTGFCDRLICCLLGMLGVPFIEAKSLCKRRLPSYVIQLLASSASQSG